MHSVMNTKSDPAKSKESPAVSRQFASTARLLSADGFSRLQAARVGVVGLGGVGSWAAEALARSGVGNFTLVDMDHVAESNINRQVQALHSTLGEAKAESLAKRMKEIHPACNIQIVDDFLTAENASDILSADHHDFWIDATDDLKAKKAMILVMQAQRRLVHLVVSGGAGGKTDPTRIEIADLAQTSQDPLLSTLRYDLRKQHGFPRDRKMRISAVYCKQPMIKGTDCDPSARLACAGYGSLVTVTAAMGLAAAAHVIQKISGV